MHQKCTVILSDLHDRTAKISGYSTGIAQTLKTKEVFGLKDALVTKRVIDLWETRFSEN